HLLDPDRLGRAGDDPLQTVIEDRNQAAGDNSRSLAEPIVPPQQTSYVDDRPKDRSTKTARIYTRATLPSRKRSRRLLEFPAAMRRLKISAISYLNTAPLMWDFEHGRPAAEGDTLSAEDFEISYTIPSRCAEALRAGSADIGIIPAVTYATIPDLVILPDAAIAAKGPVRSILLVSKTPLEQITTLAADTSSRSSVALADVLFRKFLGGARQFTPMAPDLDAMLRRCDAALLIGDPALRVNSASISPAGASRPQTSSPDYHLFDLAELWRQHTGKPFVFAFWAVRMTALADARP